MAQNRNDAPDHDHNDAKPSPEAVRDPLQAAVRLLIALLVLAVVGVLVWALFLRGGP